MGGPLGAGVKSQQHGLVNGKTFFLNSFQSIKKCQPSALEITQSVKCLLCKHKFNPIGMMAWVCNPSECEAETGRSLGLDIHPGSLTSGFHMHVHVLSHSSPSPTLRYNQPPSILNLVYGES